MYPEFESLSVDDEPVNRRVMENQLYKIQEQVTSGWVDIDEPNATKLTRDECKSDC